MIVSKKLLFFMFKYSALTLAIVGSTVLTGCVPEHTSISKSRLEEKIQTLFPQQKLGLKADKPTLTLRPAQQTLELCVNVTPVQKLLSFDGEVCAESGLGWQKDLREIRLISPKLTRLKMNGNENSVTQALRQTANLFVQQNFDQLPIYTATEWGAGLVDHFEIRDDSVRIHLKP